MNVLKSEWILEAVPPGVAGQCAAHAAREAPFAHIGKILKAQNLEAVSPGIAGQYAAYNMKRDQLGQAVGNKNTRTVFFGRAILALAETHRVPLGFHPGVLALAETHGIPLDFQRF